MWTIENGKTKLDIKKIRSNFKVVSQDGLNFIYPKKNVWDWEEEEKWLRSIVVDDDGFIVSCSWKKFGNYNEFRADTEALNHALESGAEVHFSHKEDGSLCIRSVVGNRVILRTRGTLFGGKASDDGIASYGDRFRAVAADRYPKLLDPTWMNDRSLMFEYVAPSNTIVVHYRIEDLIFLGFIMHNSLRISSWDELEIVANEGELSLVRLHNLPRDPLQMLEEIKTWKEEGIVARCTDDQIFVKVKSAYYLANHRMKFSMKYSTIVEFVGIGNIQSEMQLIEDLQKCDYDWEVLESAKKFYARYLTACKFKDDCINKAKNLFDNFLKENPDGNRSDPVIRKEYAKIACSQHGMIRSMMFCLYDGKIERLDNFCNKIILTEGKSK